MVTFDDLMKGFGVVTVMNACIFTLKDGKSYTSSKNCYTVIDDSGNYSTTTGGLKAEDFEAAGEYIDTLKIANFTQEGPTKTVTGGQYANPLIKYGKTMTAEIQDALGRASTMVRFFGCEYNGTYARKAGQVFKSPVITGDGEKKVFNIFSNTFATSDIFESEKAGLVAKDISGNTPTFSFNSNTKGVTVTFTTAPAADDIFYIEYTAQDNVVSTGSRLSITDKFPGPFAIEGDTFFIDQKTGEKHHVFILIPQFIPDAILTLTQDAEGDATVFDLNGGIGVTDIEDAEGTRSIFYEIRETSFFTEQRKALNL